MGVLSHAPTSQHYIIQRSILNVVGACDSTPKAYFDTPPLRDRSRGCSVTCVRDCFAAPLLYITTRIHTPRSLRSHGATHVAPRCGSPTEPARGEAPASSITAPVKVRKGRNTHTKPATRATPTISTSAPFFPRHHASRPRRCRIYDLSEAP